MISIICSCKKEKVSEIIDETPPASLPTGGVLIKSRSLELKGNSTTSTVDEAIAVFLYNNDSTKWIPVKSVTLNDSLLEFESPDNYYSFVFYNGLTNNCNWQVKGDNGVPDFSFSNTNPIPSFSNFSTIPDSIDKGDLSIFDHIKKKPCIFCTFHYGAYQSIIAYLTLKEIDLFVIVPSEYLVKDIMSYEGQEYHADQKVNTILADNWSSLLVLSNKLKQGKSIIILLDRLEGVNESSKEKLTKINFLDSELLVKKGIPEMSFLRKVPIVPVVCNRNSFFELDMEFFNPYLPLENENKKEYSNRVLQSIFSIFAKYTKLNPAQWEYWNEIYSRLDLTNINKLNKPTTRLSFAKKIMALFKNKKVPMKPTVENNIGEFCRFDKESFGIYKENDLYYLYNIDNFNCFKISANLANVLAVLSKEPIQWVKLKAVINPTLLEDLVAKKVLC